MSLLAAGLCLNSAIAGAMTLAWHLQGKKLKTAEADNAKLTQALDNAFGAHFDLQTEVEARKADQAKLRTQVKAHEAIIASAAAITDQVKDALRKLGQDSYILKRKHELIASTNSNYPSPHTCCPCAARMREHSDAALAQVRPTPEGHIEATKAFIKNALKVEETQRDLELEHELAAAGGVALGMDRRPVLTREQAKLMQQVASLSYARQKGVTCVSDVDEDQKLRVNSKEASAKPAVN